MINKETKHVSLLASLLSLDCLALSEGITKIKKKKDVYPVLLEY